MFVKDGQLIYAYNYLGIPPEIQVRGAAPTSGRHIVGIDFTKESMDETRV